MVQVRRFIFVGNEKVESRLASVVDNPLRITLVVETFVSPNFHLL